MEEELMFRIVFVLTYSVFASVRIYYRSQNIGRESERQETSVDAPAILLTIAILGFFAIMFLYILLPGWIFWAHIEMHIVIRWLGFILAAISIGFLYWIHRTLGYQYSAKLEIQTEHKLIEAGPYSRVRHPMYTVFISFSIAVAIIASNALMIIFTIMIAIPFHWISRREESMLIEEFGEEYQNYMKRTGRFLPPIRRKD